MIEIPENSDMLDMARILEQNGFTVMSAEANRISLNMGYTEKGFADSDRVIKLRESRRSRPKKLRSPVCQRKRHHGHTWHEIKHCEGATIMAYYFFPSCKATAQFKEASKTAREYVNQKFGIKPIGCCRPNHKKLTAEDTAIVVCNNCAAIIEENTDAEIEFLWQVIDQDPDFPFPDYHSEEMTVQDCWVAFEKRDVQDTVRSLLRKMNIRPVELKENYEKTKFCGVNLLSPCTESNAALAHKRYVEQFPHMFTPMGPDEQVEHFRRHCEQIKTDKTVCYCKFCTDAINMGGKQGIHLLELLFPARKEFR